MRIIESCILFNPYASRADMVPQLTAEAWQEWGREKGLLFSVDYEGSEVHLYSANPGDQTVHRVITFSHSKDGHARSYDRSVSSILLGSRIYMIGGLDLNDNTKGCTDVYFCDLDKSEFRWEAGPSLMAPKLYPLLFRRVGRIYALDLETHRNDPAQSFEALDPDGGWQKLAAPPFVARNPRTYEIAGVACVGDRQIVLEVCYYRDVSEFGAPDGVHVIAFYCLSVDNGEWSLLKVFKFDVHAFLTNRVVPDNVIPYRVYVQDIALFLQYRPGFQGLQAFDFGLLVDKNEACAPPIHGPRFICCPNTRPPLGQWHLYQIGDTKFCLLLFCQGPVCGLVYPAVSVCTFELAKEWRQLEVGPSVSELNANFYSPPGSDDESNEEMKTGDSDSDDEMKTGEPVDSVSEYESNKRMKTGEQVKGYICRNLQHKLSQFDVFHEYNFVSVLPEECMRGWRVYQQHIGHEPFNPMELEDEQT